MIEMLKWLIIGSGGFIGAVLRYLIGGLIQNWSRSISFPYGTLTVNLMGCFLIGAFTQIMETRAAFSPEIRLFLFIGILGAFTTFSTFSNEALNLIRAGRHDLAVVYIGLHLLLGLGCVLIGRWLSQLIWS